MSNRPAQSSVRVLIANVHKGVGLFNRTFTLPELRHAMRAPRADVGFPQQVQGDHAGHSAPLPGWLPLPWYEFLAEEMWPDVAYGRNAVYPSGHHGNAILSSHPIARYQNLDVPKAGPERRGRLRCVIDAPGVDEVHAIRAQPGMRESHRQCQPEIFCELVENGIPANAPRIVAGDFHHWHRRATPRLRRARRFEACGTPSGRLARTFPARCPVLPLDRICARKTGVHDPMVLLRRPWSHLSDYTPLAAEVGS